MFDTPNEPHKPHNRRRWLPCGGPAGALIGLAILAALIAWKLA